jgi:hypothetical protein
VYKTAQRTFTRSLFVGGLPPIAPLAAVWHIGFVTNDTNQLKESIMSVKGKIKEAAGYVEEEAYEHGKSPESQKKAQEGRDLRNDGRIEDGKLPKMTTPGTGKKED